MRSFNKMLLVAVTAVFILNFAGVGFAAEKRTAVKIVDKFKRGVLNLVTGLFEVPKNIINTTKESNIFVGLTLGSAKGVGMAVVRTGAGIYEALTFPVPVPANYEAILEPEMVFNKEESVANPSAPAQAQTETKAQTQTQSADVPPPAAQPESQAPAQK